MFPLLSNVYMFRIRSKSAVFCYGSGDTHSSGRGEAREEASFCPDCAVISQGFYSRSEKLNTNFYTDSAEVRHLGWTLGQLSGIQPGPGCGVRVPRRVVTQLIGGSWGRKLGSSSPVVIMQPVRNQFELLKVSTNGSLPLPSPWPVQESGSRWWWLAVAGLPWSPELDFLLPPLNHAHPPPPQPPATAPATSSQLLYLHVYMLSIYNSR